MLVPAIKDEKLMHRVKVVHDLSSPAIGKGLKDQKPKEVLPAGKGYTD